MAEHGQKLVLCHIGARFLFQFQVRLPQLDGERLRLFEQVFCSRACFDRVEHNADALGQLVQERLVCGTESLD